MGRTVSIPEGRRRGAPDRPAARARRPRLLRRPREPGERRALRRLPGHDALGARALGAPGEPVGLGRDLRLEARGGARMEPRRVQRR
jgi:hypothetical protein